MPEGVGDLTVRLELDPSRRFLVLPVQVGPHSLLRFMINPAIGRSIITEQTRHDLIMAELIEPNDQLSHYRLRDLSVQDQRLPDIVAYVSRRLTRPDGMLGMEFLRNYIEVRFNPRTGQLHLIDP